MRDSIKSKVLGEEGVGFGEGNPKTHSFIYPMTR